MANAEPGARQRDDDVIAARSSYITTASDAGTLSLSTGHRLLVVADPDSLALPARRIGSAPPDDSN